MPNAAAGFETLGAFNNLTYNKGIAIDRARVKRKVTFKFCLIYLGRYYRYINVIIVGIPTEQRGVM